MTNKLSDEDICRLMGWVELVDGWHTIGDFFGEGKQRTSGYPVDIPDFSDERNIFKWVVPWLVEKGYEVHIKTMFSLFEVYIQHITHEAPIAWGNDKVFPDAFRAALAQMKNQQEDS